MADAIMMPDLGSGTEEGTLLNWLKQVGDSINAGDVIAEVESDKATVEVPSNVGGTIIQLVGQPGEALKVGAVIGYVGAAGEAPNAEDPNAAPIPAAAEPTQTAGRSAAATLPPTEASTRAMESGVKEAAFGTPTGNGAPRPNDAPPVQVPAASGDAGAASADADGGHLPDGVKASPVARRIAQEKQIDLRQIKGSGPGGRIVREDVEHYTPAAAAPAAPAPAPAPAAAQAAPATGGAALPGQHFGTPPADDVETVEVTRLRATIARRMTESKQYVPHFYVTTDVDVTALLDLRKQLNANLDDDHKISVNDLIVKATALTLRKFPNLNSHFYGDKIIRHKRIHIGMAVALPEGGLMNVVAKDADKVALGTMAAHNKEMIARARERKVKPEDVQGSTFTVSNLGAYDVDHFSAIINPPEAGILAVSSAKKIPVVLEDGSIGVANRMKVTISVDHRVSDGAEAALYLQQFKKLVESPMQLLI
ncbi:MAG: dihydrolipoamide acetyltransferase family protein [bacterium]|nr:dihydrolipoamide acetyltransferase family protein [bacterium]